MTTNNNRVLYQIKFTLLEIHPSIWRRIQIWEGATLEKLHGTLQIIMGWEDCHLHEFSIGCRIHSVPDTDDDLYERKVIDERRVQLKEAVSRVATHFEYLYDFGDSWRHDLQLEAIVIPDPERTYPCRLAGERRTPPEDVRGPSGYTEYLEAMADPGHEEHENVLRCQGPFDPEAFSLTAVNQRLRKRFHLGRNTASAHNSPP